MIGLIELYACVAALQHWADDITGNRVLLFVDNFGAQDCLVKGTASVASWRSLLMILERGDDQLFANLWVARVPSDSNPSDHPSRGSISELAFLGRMAHCFPKCPVTGTDMQVIC